MGLAHFSGPLVVGPRKAATGSTPATFGDVQLVCFGSVTVNGATAVAVAANAVPKGARIFGVTVAGTITGTSPTVNIGTTTTATELVNGQTVTSATAFFLPAPTAGSYLTGGCAALSSDTVLYFKSVAGATGTVNVFVEYIMPNGLTNTVASPSTTSPFANGNI